MPSFSPGDWAPGLDYIAHDAGRQSSQSVQPECIMRDLAGSGPLGNGGVSYYPDAALHLPGPAPLNVEPEQNDSDFFSSFSTLRVISDPLILSCKTCQFL